MKQEEQDAYIRESAALILAAMVTGRTMKLPPPEVPPEASEQRKAERAKERAEFERRQATERMHLAAEAFQLAGALAAESELWAGPVDHEGNPLDARAFDRECTHGRKSSEPCAECDRMEEARLAEKTGKTGDGDNGGE